MVRSEIEMIEKKAKKIGFRVRLVGRVEKWEDGKYLGFLMCVWLEGWKNGRVENSFD